MLSDEVEESISSSQRIIVENAQQFLLLFFSWNIGFTAQYDRDSLGNFQWKEKSIAHRWLSCLLLLREISRGLREVQQRSGTRYSTIGRNFFIIPSWAHWKKNPFGCEVAQCTLCRDPENVHVFLFLILILTSVVFPLASAHSIVFSIISFFSRLLFLVIEKNSRMSSWEKRIIMNQLDMETYARNNYDAIRGETLEILTLVQLAKKGNLCRGSSFSRFTILCKGSLRMLFYCLFRFDCLPISSRMNHHADSRITEVVELP